MSSSYKSSLAVAAITLATSVHAWYPNMPPCLDTYQPFKSMGCYDNGSNGAPGALMERMDMSSDNMTTEACISTCKGNGFGYAALGWIGTCYCGQTINRKPVPSDQCNLQCSGNSKETCGGDSTVAIYQDTTFPDITTLTTDAYTHMGCYTDDDKGRPVFFRQDNVNSTTLTTKLCLQSCLAGGFPYAATEYGGECYCGVVLGKGVSLTDDKECNSPCNGASTEMCGGGSRQNVYLAKGCQSTQPCGYVPPAPPVSVSVSTMSTIASSNAVSTPESTPATSVIETPSSTSTEIVSTASTLAESSYTPSSQPVSTTPIVTPTPVTSTPLSTSTVTLVTSITSTPLTTPIITPVTSAPLTTLQTSAITSSPAVCSSVVVSPPKCDFGCGKFCYSLPDFKDSKGCSDAASHCMVNAASCYMKAGLPDALNCVGFSQWCGKVSDYCKASPNGNKESCLKSWPPVKPTIKPELTTDTMTMPCTIKAVSSAQPVLTTTLTTAPVVTKTATTTCPIATPTGICQQPKNTKNGYDVNSPLGGIKLPALTCNNVEAEHKAGNIFKLYTDQDTKKCTSFAPPKVADACVQACQTQHDRCVSVYAEGCRTKGKYNGKSFGLGYSPNGAFAGQRRSYLEAREAAAAASFSDSYDGAKTKCGQQLQDCLSVNKKAVSDKCKKYGNFS